VFTTSKTDFAYSQVKPSKPF